MSIIYIGKNDEPIRMEVDKNGIDIYAEGYAVVNGTKIDIEDIYRIEN